MKSQRLDSREIQARLQPLALTGWQRSESQEVLEKTYRCSSFTSALEFVMRVGTEAERSNHHPQITIDYRSVTLRLTTHDCGGLSALDFAAAAAYDKLE